MDGFPPDRSGSIELINVAQLHTDVRLFARFRHCEGNDGTRLTSVSLALRRPELS